MDRTIIAHQCPPLVQKPSFLGVPILARHDPNGRFSKGNLYFRTALSDEEAREGIELYIAAELRDRITKPLSTNACGFFCTSALLPACQPPP